MEQEVTLEALPAAARAAIEKRAGTGRIVKVERVRRGGATTYEGTYRVGERKHEIAVTAEGARLRID